MTESQIILLPYINSSIPKDALDLRGASEPALSPKIGLSLEDIKRLPASTTYSHLHNGGQLWITGASVLDVENWIKSCDLPTELKSEVYYRLRNSLRNK